MKNAIFDRLTVIAAAPRNHEGRKMWLCRCVCGQTKTVLEKSLVRGATRSCGCLFREGNAVTHGYRKNGKRNKTYEIWKSLRQRCNNPNNKDYPDYGGRGITHDPRWDSFSCFLEDMGEKPQGLMIERIDNNGPYCKANCKWGTPEEQARNRRGARRITVDGITKPLAEWSELMGVDYHTLYSRLGRTGKITIN